MFFRFEVFPRMLRVCNSAHEPLHTPRTPKSPNAEILRKQIVGMLQEEQGKENDKPLKNQTPLIYQIKRKGAIETITKPDHKTERQIERIKRSHLRFIREANSSKSKTFPSIENYVLQGEAKDTGRSVEMDDPSKRTWALPGDQRQEPKLKNVRFHMQDEVKRNKLQDDSAEPIEKDNRGIFCEIRGNAIQSYDTCGKLLKPNLRQRRSEAAKRQTTIHTSLQLFKRRLKINHESYITPSITTNHDNDYIIRRVSFKNSQNANMAVPRASSAAKPVIEPRLSVTPTQRPKSSIAPCLHVHKTMLKTRPQSSPESHPHESHLLKPRLQDNVNNIDNVSFQEEQETVANVVNTYFVEQSKPKARQLYQSSLSTHNIDVHNSLTACPDARMKVVNCDHKFDNRFLKWLEESSANSEDARRAAMRIHQEPPKSPLLPPCHDETEL